jgi:hypothetical protein
LRDDDVVMEARAFAHKSAHHPTAYSIDAGHGPHGGSQLIRCPVDGIRIAGA